MKTSFHYSFMHLKRHFDLSRPLQVPISGACIHLKPLVVFIHDNLFLYTIHITQVCFPSYQKDSCHHSDRNTPVAELQKSEWNVHRVHILQLKCELMDAAVHISTEFLLFWRFFFAGSFSDVCFIDGTQTRLCK